VLPWMRQETWDGTTTRRESQDALKGACPVRKGAVGNAITTVRMWITRAGRLPYPSPRLVCQWASHQSAHRLQSRS
jgi:hypothetical protein